MDQQETKACKYCTREIPASAKVCPYCNRKQSHTVRNVILIVVGVILVLALIGSFMAGGNNNQNASTSNQATTDSQAATSNSGTTTKSDSSSNSNSGAATKKTQDYTVGSTFTSGDVSATLNYVSTSYGTDFTPAPDGKVFLITNWTVTNNGDEEFNPFNFTTSGYADGQTVDLAITSIPDQFDMGTMMIPGSSSTGNKVFEVPEGWSEFQIRVQLGMINGDTAIFKVSPNQVS